MRSLQKTVQFGQKLRYGGSDGGRHFSPDGQAVRTLHGQHEYVVGDTEIQTPG
jgi:hypothetical protein